MTPRQRDTRAAVPGGEPAWAGAGPAPTVAVARWLEILRQCTIPRSAAHPGLYFSREDVPGLRARARDRADLLGPIVETADKRLADPNVRGRAMNPEELALLYQVTGEERFAAATREAVAEILDEPDWVVLAHKPLRVDLTVARIARVLGEVYDALYDLLEDAERDRIRQQLIERALRPYLEVERAKSEWWSVSQNNWRSFVCGNLGNAALCLRDVYDDVQECVEWAMEGVVAFLEVGGRDGGYYEGIGYWGGGYTEVVRFAEVLRRASAGAVDLYQHPYLQVTGDFGLYGTTGDGGSFNFSDSKSRHANPSLMARLAAEYRHPHYQWFVEKYLPQDVYGFLWLDPDLKAEAPPRESRSKHFRGVDVAVMGTGWGAQDAFVGLKSGWTTGGHCHLDVNSFVFRALGQPWVVDLGGWPYAHYRGFFDCRGGRWQFEGNNAFGHNALSVDGQGQTFGVPGYEEHYNQHHLGRILRFHTSEPIDYVVGDGTEAYGGLLTKYLRYLVLVKGTAEAPGDYVVVLDDVRANPARVVEGRLHHEAERVEIGDGRARLERGDAVCEVQFADSSGPVGWNIADVRKLSTYDASNRRAENERRYLTYEPFRHIQEGQLVAVLYPHPAAASGGLEVKVSRDADDPDLEKTVTVEVQAGARRDVLRFDLAYWQEGGTVQLNP